MTLIIQKPTGAKLNLAKNYPADDDSRAYIAAVEAADGQALESGVKMAIDAFVVGCKTDGIWNAIKASCILAGARTLNGALVPLVGVAPSNTNFIDSDYSRTLGLAGRGGCFLDSNRNNNADPQDSKHVSVFASVQSNPTGTQTEVYLGTTVNQTGSTYIGRSSTGGRVLAAQLNASSNAFAITGTSTPAGFIAASRINSNSVNARAAATNYSGTNTSQIPLSSALTIFRASNGSFTASTTLAFYSIGESLDLALLDTRVTDLINAFAAAIP
jgi:hypothetical protein